MNAISRDTFLEKGGHVSLRRFAFWWLNRRPIVPPVDGIRHVGGFAGIVLYREAPFQVQLFIAQPSAIAPPHVHPNVDSLEMIICGTSCFRTATEETINGLLHVKPGEDHSVDVSETGVSFLSFQRWPEGAAPSSVDLDWTGAPIDETHAREVGR